jgi:branched-chain amino acid transport system substrate-binding protein
MGTALLGAALLAAGCSSSGGSNTAKGAAQTSSTSGSQPSSGSNSGTQAPSGSPVVIADISDASGFPGDPLGQFAVAEKAAIDYVNNQLGGFAGHPVKLWTCDSKTDPAANVSCAQQGILQHPIASIGLSINWSANGLPIWSKAGIPSMNAPVGPADFTNPLSFPIVGGTYSESLAQGQWMAKDRGFTKASFVGLDAAANREQADEIEAGMKQKNPAATFSKTFFPLTAADLTPAVISSISSKPQMVANGSAGAQSVQVWKILAQNGYTPDKTIATSGSLDFQNVLEPAGSAIEGAYFSDPFISFDDTSDPQVSEYVNAMKQYAPGVNPRSGFLQWGFANIMTLDTISKKIPAGELTASSLANFLKGTTDLPVFMSNKLLASSAADPKFPAVRNPYVRIVQWRDGKLVNVTPFFNTLAP